MRETRTSPVRSIVENLRLHTHTHRLSVPAPTTTVIIQSTHIIQTRLLLRSAEQTSQTDTDARTLAPSTPFFPLQASPSLAFSDPEPRYLCWVPLQLLTHCCSPRTVSLLLRPRLPCAVRIPCTYLPGQTDPNSDQCECHCGYPNWFLSTGQETRHASVIQDRPSIHCRCRQSYTCRCCPELTIHSPAQRRKLQTNRLTGLECLTQRNAPRKRTARGMQSKD